MIEYAVVLTVLGVLAIIIFLRHPKSSATYERLLMDASGVKRISEKHIRTALRVKNSITSSVRGEGVTAQNRLDKLVIVLLGFGGLFMRILHKKTFTVRELIVEADLAIDTVREWINDSLELGLIQKVKSVHGYYAYRIDQEKTISDLNYLREKINEFTGIREVGVREIAGIDEAFDALRKTLELIMPLKDNFRYLVTNQFTTQDLESLGLRGPALNRWLDESSRLEIITVNEDDKYSVSRSNLEEILARFNSSVTKIIEALRK